MLVNSELVQTCIKSHFSSGLVSGGKSEAEEVLNKLKTGLGGFGAVGPKVSGFGGWQILQPNYVLTNGEPEGVQAFNTTKRRARTLVPRQAGMPCPLDRDIVLVVDSSGSVGEKNFQQAFEDLGRLIPHLCGFQPDIITRCRSTRVAVVTYGSVRSQSLQRQTHFSDKRPE